MDSADPKLDLNRAVGKASRWSVGRLSGLAIAAGYFQASRSVFFVLADLKSATVLDRLQVAKHFIDNFNWPVHVRVVQLKARLFVVSSRQHSYVDVLEIVDSSLLVNFDSLHPTRVSE